MRILIICVYLMVAIVSGCSSYSPTLPPPAVKIERRPTGFSPTMTFAITPSINAPGITSVVTRFTASGTGYFLDCKNGAPICHISLLRLFGSGGVPLGSSQTVKISMNINSSGFKPYGEATIKNDEFLLPSFKILSDQAILFHEANARKASGRTVSKNAVLPLLKANGAYVAVCAFNGDRLFLSNKTGTPQLGGVSAEDLLRCSGL